MYLQDVRSLMLFEHLHGDPGHRTGSHRSTWNSKTFKYNTHICTMHERGYNNRGKILGTKRHTKHI
jgi:hypothetical protein